MRESDTTNHQAASVVERYRRMAAITVGAVIFLIFVGGLVRMTGSGLGCPDWPKCFGSWVPPTDISQLPADYKTRFQVAGREIEDFSAFHTWVEYVNRLVGVLIGGLIILTLLASWPMRKSKPAILRLSIAALVMVLAEGLIGAYVVRTHLDTGLITVHMVMALAIMAALVLALLYASEDRMAEMRKAIGNRSQEIGIVAIVLLGLTIFQIVLGTQVREQVDSAAILLGEAERGSWIAELGSVFTIHQWVAPLIAAGVLLLIYRLKDLMARFALLRFLVLAILLLTSAEIMLGLGMKNLGMPLWFQPLHLLTATMLIGAEIVLAGSFLLGQSPRPAAIERQTMNI